jgi:hypothetical protein
VSGNNNLPGGIGIMAKIFLSYRRDDAAGHVGRLFDRLRDTFNEAEVFYDTSGIAPGTRWLDEIDKQLRDCEVLLAIIGKRWVTQKLRGPNDYVHLEILSALNRGVFVIPVLVDSAELPEKTELPYDLWELLALQAHWLSDKSQSAYSESVEQLKSIIKKQLEDPLVNFYTPRLALIVRRKEVTRQKIPDDTEIASTDPIFERLLGMFPHPQKDLPEIHSWVDIEKVVRSTSEGSWIDSLAESIHAVCTARFFKPIDVIIGINNTQYRPVITMSRPVGTERVYVEIIFVEEPEAGK